MDSKKCGLHSTSVTDKHVATCSKEQASAGLPITELYFNPISSKRIITIL